MVAVLLEHGADPERLDATGRTPLIVAASLGMESTVRQLLTSQKGNGNLNALHVSSDSVHSALSYAILGNHSRVVRVLVAAGAITSWDATLTSALLWNHTSVPVIGLGPAAVDMAIERGDSLIIEVISSK